MSLNSFIYGIFENVIKKINGIENLPDSEELKAKIDEIDKKIKYMILQNEEYSEIGKYYENLRNMEEKLSLRKRIDAGVSTLFYFVYTITGSIIGFGFSIAIFLRQEVLLGIF